MSGHERFFSPEPAASHLRVNTASEATVRHEVMYEQSLTKIRHRPLYVGSAFSKRRFLGAFVISAVCMSGLIVRAFWMQKIDVARYEKLAEANRLRSLPIWPQRGIIRDREGKVLAENTTRFQVVMTPRDLLADPTAKTDELGVAARLLAKSVTDLLPLATATGTTRDEGQPGIAPESRRNEAPNSKAAWMKTTAGGLGVFLERDARGTEIFESDEEPAEGNRGRFQS
jgi:hypothetical protein